MNGAAVTTFGTVAGYDSTGKVVDALSTTATNGQAITLTVDAGCTVKYETNAADWNALAHTVTVRDDSVINIGSQGAGWTLIQIIAEDGSETVIGFVTA